MFRYSKKKNVLTIGNPKNKTDKYTQAQAQTLASLTNFSARNEIALLKNQPLETIILKLKESIENGKFEKNNCEKQNITEEINCKNTVNFTDSTDVCKDENHNNVKDIKKKTSDIKTRDLLHEWKLTNLFNKTLIILGGVDPRCPQTNDGQGKNVLIYNSLENKWDHLSSMPGSRHHHSSVNYKGKIYVMGGTRPAFHRQKPNITQTVWSFDPHLLQWCNEKSLPFPRRDFGLIANENGFYVIGGEEDADKFPVATTFFYDICTKFWQKKASLNLSRSGLMITLVNNNKIWAAGGIIEKEGEYVLTDNIEEYNIDLDLWKEVGKLSDPRCYGKLCCVKNSGLYVIGGVSYERESNKLTSLSTIEKYIPHNNNWVKVGDLSMPRHGHDVIVVNDQILIFGGVSTDTRRAYRTVECFSTKTCKLIDGIVSLPNPTSGLSAIVMEKINKIENMETRGLI